MKKIMIAVAILIIVLFFLTPVASEEKRIARATVMGGIDPLEAVTYGKLWVVVGWGGTILTSHDGFHWTRQESKTALDFRAVAYGNKLYVAVGDWGVVYSSPDGVSWTRRNMSGKYRLTDVQYTGSRWFATGSSGTVLSSTNGITW